MGRRRFSVIVYKFDFLSIYVYVTMKVRVIES